MKKKRINPYQELTDNIIKSLKEGTVPWKKSWQTLKVGYPRNMISNNIYKGANFFMTMFQDHPCPMWLSYKQAKDLGGNIKKGEAGTKIIFFRMMETKDSEGKISKFPMIQRSVVFNLNQTEGLKNKWAEKLQVLEDIKDEFTPIEKTQQLLKKIHDKLPELKHDLLYQACYMPGLDIIKMPNKKLFKTPESYYAILFHEICHSTGHALRLNRNSLTEGGSMKSKSYALEELVAELSSSFLCAYCGIINSTQQQTEAYLKSWINKLNSDPKIIYNAMKEGFKILEYFELIPKDDKNE